MLVIEAAAVRSKSLISTKAVAKHVRGPLKFYLDTRDESACKLTGEPSLVLLHDYLESLAERGRAVPWAARRALHIWPEALGIDWPLANPLVISAATAPTNELPKQAPSMPPDAVRLIEGVALNIEVAPRRRAYASAILLMSYASLRFSDARRLKSFDVNHDSIRGALLTCKTKKTHGKNWPWACPRTGITSSTD